APDTLGLETEIVPPLVLEPEGVALADPEEDAALELERGSAPAGAERDLAIVRGQAHENGWNPFPQGHASVVDHAVYGNGPYGFPQPFGVRVTGRAHARVGPAGRGTGRCASPIRGARRCRSWGVPGGPR